MILALDIARAIEHAVGKAHWTYSQRDHSGYGGGRSLGPCEIRRTAQVKGYASDLEVSKYYLHPDSLLVQVTYCEGGYKTLIEVTPDGRTSIWAD